jgi:hypothetical protein
MTLPPIYTNPNANATMDQRYTPYAPPVQRNQPPAPQQHARTVEVAGMVFPSGHGAATADILDERTLQNIGRISLDDMRRWGLRSGDVIRGQVEERGNRRSLVNLDSVNDDTPESARERPHFDQLTATFPDRRVRLEQNARPISARIIDLFAPLGFGSRALIVAPPKTGKTTLIREAAEAVLLGYPDAVVMAVLVGERPEEVTDLRSRLEPRGGHVYAASFDESTDPGSCGARQARSGVGSRRLYGARLAHPPGPRRKPLGAQRRAHALRRHRRAGARYGPSGLRRGA